MKGSTRGRGANPKTGRRSTLPSNTPLHYLNTSGTSLLNLKSLLSHYKPYFGLFLSKLYGGLDPLKKVNSQLKYKTSSPLGLVFHSNLNKQLPKEDRLNLYNSGSKITTLLLNVMKDESNPLISLEPQLRRKLKYSWESLNQKAIKERMTKLQLHLKSDFSDKTSFKKYSELQLNSDTLDRYKASYALHKGTPKP